MIDHLIDSRDDTFLTKCMYCNSELDDRESEFMENRHYKTIICKTCGKVHRHVVDFQGSGHDSWNQDVLNLAKKNLEN